MAAEGHVTARVRQIPLGVQFFLFFVLSQALKYFALMAPGGPHGLTVLNGVLIAGCFLPFAIARVPGLMRWMPGVVLRDGAQVQLLPGGLIYTYDGVKRPLFVDWPDMARIEKTRHGLVLEVRNRANLTEAMPKYQAEFWRARIAKPIRLIWVDDLRAAADDTGDLARCLAGARRAAVQVTGFNPAPDTVPRPARA